MNRRSFIRLVGGGVVWAAALPGLSGCSNKLPPQAIAAWRPRQQYSDIRKWLISYAILAPHSHNLQAWLVDISTPHEITLFCDTTRLLPETDPFSRQTILSQGTFIELLDMAAKERGLRTEITLFPEGAFAADKVDDRPTARIRLAEDKNVTKDPLFSQIIKRRTNREPYEMREPALEALSRIKESVAPYPVHADFVLLDESDIIAKHRAIAVEGYRIELTTPRTIMESYKVLRIGPGEIARYRDGISINDPFVRFAAAVGLFDRTKTPAPNDSAITGQIKEFQEKIEKTPAFFWMTTEGNDRTTQVNAGRAFVRAQLAATAQGLSMQPISQALQEFPEMQNQYEKIHRLLGASEQNHTVQMWTRLGYGPDISPSPRRGSTEHILHG